jgi:predicted DNA-binding protein with PD1-like motif
MQLKKINNQIILVINKDEKVVESIKKIVTQEKITAGSFKAIGALKEIKLGFYHLHTKKYDEKFFEEDHELLSLDGNISWLDNTPVVHCHAVLGNTDFQAIGGHLFEATVAVTCEVFINLASCELKRQFIPEIGLNLLKIE